MTQNNMIILKTRTVNGQTTNDSRRNRNTDHDKQELE